MSEMAILSGVPMPQKYVGRSTKYPFADLNVGDAFDAPVGERKSLSQSAYKYGKSNNMRFTVHCISDTHVRCWRMA